ncbi:MAG: DUF4230 domain-containing protein [Spirochaetes bacterium]|nr:DUF4230 domain-containing protein [Spirochaetota bacterium]
MDDSIVFILRLLLIFLVIFLCAIIYVFYNKNKNKLNLVNESTIVEQIKKVFKLSIIELNISEIYNYEKAKNILFISFKKKALIIVNAKVIIGFDFEKSKISYIKEDKKLIFEKLDGPEVISIDTNYNFYDIQYSFFNKISEKDINEFLIEIKEKLKNKILNDQYKKYCFNILINGLKNLCNIFDLKLEFSNKILMIEEGNKNDNS